jgi:hypothetical protein|nr:MAG TPA_asm: hypothetical protein [Caudoviricetes sp.]
MLYVTIIPGEDADLRDLMCGFGKYLARNDDSFIIHFPPKIIVFEDYKDRIVWSNQNSDKLKYLGALERARRLTLKLAVIH